MDKFISINIRTAVYEKLRRLALLTGDESSAIERLISHWETSPGESGMTKALHHVPKITYWTSPTGDRLPIGTEIRASYLGKTHLAKVHPDGIDIEGKIYDSLTAAGEAIKRSAGRSGTAMRTNGRTFWKIRDPRTNRWVSIKDLQSRYLIDADAALVELMESR